MEYRNVFREIGISEEEIAARLKEIVNTFFYDAEEKVYHLVGDDMAYIEDTGNVDARTEGMSYGMMMCVQLDMKEEFDRLWKWAKTYMWMDSGENEGYFAWSCAPDGTKNAYGPAPDGEEFFAMALFLPLTDGETEKAFFSMKRRQRTFCRPASIKGKMDGRESLCGIGRIIRFCLYRGLPLPIPPIICRIFMSCLQSGPIRRTVHFGRRRRPSAGGIWRRMP